MSAWTSVLKTSKKAVFGLMVLVALWWAYRIVVRLVFKNGSKPEKVPEFAPTDLVNGAFKPVVGAITDIDSDRTTDAVLSGAYGPCVVMFYADWCHHCRNMEAAYAAAAAAASIPFLRVEGSKTPVCNRKHAVGGYPTILGVANMPGLPRRFNAVRSVESLLEFALALTGVVKKDALVAPVVLPDAEKAEKEPSVEAIAPTLVSQ